MTSADASFDAVQLSLRGQLFSTTRAVLTVYPGSYFEVMLRSADMRHEQGGATREPFVIDRPPQLFSWILTLMQAEHSALGWLFEKEFQSGNLWEISGDLAHSNRALKCGCSSLPTHGVS